MSSNQDDIFSASEGDQWFQRNRDAINNQAHRDADATLRLLAKHPDIQPQRALEIGCANGWRLEELRKRYGAAGTGVEPSTKAVAEGEKLFPNLHLHKGVAASLPLPDAEFDLVILHLTLHWIARPNLFRSLAEIDRVTADGGYLIIADFLPAAPTKVTYHHLPGQNVFTYKQDYAQIFTASSLYKELDRMFFHHDLRVPDDQIPPNARSSCTLLQKSLQDLYQTQEFLP